MKLRMLISKGEQQRLIAHSRVYIFRAQEVGGIVVVLGLQAAHFTECSARS